MSGGANPMKNATPEPSATSADATASPPLSSAGTKARRPLTMMVSANRPVPIATARIRERVVPADASAPRPKTTAQYTRTATKDAAMASVIAAGYGGGTARYRAIDSTTPAIAAALVQRGTPR